MLLHDTLTPVLETSFRSKNFDASDAYAFLLCCIGTSFGLLLWLKGIQQVATCLEAVQELERVLLFAVLLHSLWHCCHQ